MADNFGLKIGIEGEREFKNALKEINQSFKVLGSEMNMVISQFDKQDKSMQALTARNNVLNKEIDTQKDKISTLEKALNNAATSFGENDKRTREWQVQLNNANADLNKMQRELDDNIKSIDELSKGFNEAEKEVGDFSKEIVNASEKADDAGRRFEKLGGVLTGIAASIGAAMVGAGAAVVKISDEYITSLNDFQAATGTASEDMGQFQEAMQNIYRGNYGENLDDIGNALSVVAQNSKDISPEEIEKLTTNAILLRDTFDYDIQESMRAVNMLTKQFGITGEEAFNLIAQGTQNGLNKNGDFLDSLNEYSLHYSQLGLDADDMLNSLINGTEAGTFSVDKLGDAIKEFGIRVKDESKGTMNAFTTLGLDANNISIAFAEGGDKASASFEQVIERLKEIDDPLQQNQAGVALFGTMWEDLGKDGVFALANLNGEIDKSNEALSKINEVKYNSIGEAVSGLGRMFTADFVLPISNGVLPILSELGTALNEAGGDWGKISTAIGDALNSLITVIMQRLPQMLTLGTEILMSIITGLIDALPQITEGAVLLLLTLVDGIVANLPALVEGALLMVVALATGIGEALPELTPAIVDTVIMIVDTIINNMDKILEAAFKIIEGLAIGIINALPRLLEALPLIITSIIDFVTNNLPRIAELGITLVVQLGAGLIMAIPKLVTSYNQISDSIIKGIGKAAIAIVEVGKNIVIGLWEGIASMMGWIKEKISGFVSGIVTNVKGVLGIQSPSTVFAGIGTNMSLGLGEGFTKAMNTVKDDMKKSIPTNFDIDTSLRNGSNLMSGSNSNITNTFNISNMIVRNDNDIKNIARELYLLQTRSDRGYAI